MLRILLVLLLLTLVGCSNKDEIERLKARISTLETQVDELNKKMDDAILASAEVKSFEAMAEGAGGYGPSFKKVLDEVNSNIPKEGGEKQKPGLYINGQLNGKMIQGKENVVKYISYEHVYPSYEYSVVNGRRIRRGNDWIIIPNYSDYDNATTVTVMGVEPNGTLVRLLSFNGTAKK